MDEAQLFVDTVITARAAWQAAVNQIPLEDWEQAGFCGDWSLKDVIAHIAWYEREMIHLLETRRFEGSELWELPTDERNAQIYLLKKDQPLTQVLASAIMTYKQLLPLLEQISAAELLDPAAFAGMPPEWTPRQILAGSTHLHYDEHRQQAEAWAKNHPQN